MKKAAPKPVQNPPLNPAESLQLGMNRARGFIFKHMGSEHRARYLLRKAMTQMGGL